MVGDGSFFLFHLSLLFCFDFIPHSVFYFFFVFFVVIVICRTGNGCCI